jgi:hypothetical protein
MYGRIDRSGYGYLASELDEHILNLVTLTVKHAVLFDRRFAIGF